ncbi:carotene biosynthesis protein [Halobacteriales archaeon SW_7_68_16]|nr:MAG: carotene biosynthesis protein [Halobacteriales archaeon SW_7_68_16]
MPDDAHRRLVGAAIDGDRRAFETALTALVRDHRFTIAVVFPAVGAITLVASALGSVTVAGTTVVVPEVLRYNAVGLFGGTLVMRLPLIAAILPLVDRRAAALIAGLAAYAYGIEFVGLRTGWPYGEFTYLIDLGPTVAGDVPLGLPIFFFPLVLNAYLLVLLLGGGRTDRTILRLPATILTVLAIDAVLDPGAVAVGFWAYAEGGYYGVPLSNYLGWVLSATVAVAAFDRAFPVARLRERLVACEFALDDMMSFVVLWGSINVLFGQWIPATLAVGFGIGLLATDRFDFDVSDSRLVGVVRRG